MAQFHESGYGRLFFGTQLPSLIKQLERIANAIDGKKVPRFTEEERQLLKPLTDPGANISRTSESITLSLTREEYAKIVELCEDDVV